MGYDMMISVIVPVYKVERYLDQCVESIAGQTYRDLEIILVDDGSPDGCPALCDAWAARDSRIRVIHKANKGVSSSRNTGIEHTSGRYLLFVDSDDVLEAGLIEKLWNSLQAHPQTEIAVSGVRRILEDDTPTEREGRPETAEISWDQISTFRGGWYTWGILYPRKLIDQFALRFCPEIRNLEDMLWNSIFSLYTNRLVYVGDAIYDYRIRQSSITSQCVDAAWQADSEFRIAAELGEYSKIHTLDPRQTGTLLKRRRTCINAGAMEQFMSGEKTSEQGSTYLRKSRIGVRTVWNCQLPMKRKAMELLAALCPALESMTAYHWIFHMRKIKKGHGHLWRRAQGRR